MQPLTPEATSALGAALNTIKPEGQLPGNVMDPGILGLVQRINSLLSPIPGLGLLGGLGGPMSVLGGPMSTLGNPLGLLGGLFGGQQQANPLAMLFGGLFGGQQQPAPPQPRPQRGATNRAGLLGR